MTFKIYLKMITVDGCQLSVITFFPLLGKTNSFTHGSTMRQNGGLQHVTKDESRR